MTDDITRERIEAAIQQFENTPGWWDAESWEVVKTLALEADRLRADIVTWRNHAKGIVYGGEPLDIAEAILAEHPENVPQGAHSVKLDDELCRPCAFAQVIKQTSLEADRLRAALEQTREAMLNGLEHATCAHLGRNPVTEVIRILTSSRSRASACGLILEEPRD